jgi:hypothetical protein
LATNLALDLIGDGFREDAARRITSRIIRVWSVYVKLGWDIKGDRLRFYKALLS